MFRNKVENYISKYKDTLSKIDMREISNCTNVINNAWKYEKQIFVCGNGGSALTASHFVTDWNKSIFLETGKSFKGVCLADNIGIVTAYANDIDYNEIFSEQLKNLMQKEDILICISGSGNSENIVLAANYAKKINCKTIGLTGFDGGKLKNIVDYSYHVPINDMQIAEDFHLMFGHIVMQSLCDY